MKHFGTRVVHAFEAALEGVLDIADHALAPGSGMNLNDDLHDHTQFKLKKVNANAKAA